MSNKCVCSSGKAFSQCCEPLLLNHRVAKTPVQLMRSRFSAFALGGHGDYLLNTWAVSGVEGLSAAELSVKSVNWQRLNIISKSQTGNAGHVEFKATFLDSNNNEQSHHEYSRFERIAGRWFYIDGDIYDEP